MRRLLSGWIVCIMLAGVLLGCGKPENRNESASEATAAPTVTAMQTATPEPTSEPTPLPEITQSVHKRESKYYAYFKTYVLETAQCTVQVEDVIFSEETICRLAEAIEADLNAIGERLGETPQHVTVYAVKQPRTGQPISVEDRVFCSVKDIETGAYRGALCGACFGMENPWKQYGLQTIVFGTLDETGLREYYADPSHMHSASCAAVFLSPLSADDETLEMTRRTAASITAFVMESGGLDALRGVTSTSEVLADWQAHIGIKKPLMLLIKDADVACMRVESDYRYLYAVRLENFVFYVADGSFAQTANDMYAFLCLFYYGMQSVWDTIRDDAPEYLELAEKRFKEPITVYIKQTVTGWSVTTRNEIVLTTVDEIWWAMVHILLWCDKFNKDLTWQNEAIAQHFSRRAWSECWPLNEEAHLSEHRQLVIDRFSAKNGEQFITFVQAVYRSLRETDTVLPQGRFSEPLYARAFGIAYLLMPDNPDTDRPTVSGLSDHGNKSVDGNGLKYEEALAFFDYLMDTYGKETVMDGYMSGASIEKTYGKSYPELYREFYSYLKETYGYLLTDK